MKIFHISDLIDSYEIMPVKLCSIFSIRKRNGNFSNKIARFQHKKLQHFEITQMLEVNTVNMPGVYIFHYFIRR